MSESRLKTFLGITSAAAISMLGVGIVASGLPARVITLSGGDASLVGLLASCFALPYIFLQVPFGNLSDRYGFKPFLLFGYFLSAVSGIIFYFAGSPMPIFIGRAVQGAGEIPVWATAPAIISIAYPCNKGKMIGIYTAAVYIMLAAGPLLVPSMPDLFGERGGFLFFSFLCCIAFMIIFFTQKNRRPGPGSKKESLEIKKAFSLLSDIPVRIVLLGIFLYGCGQGLLFSIAPGWLVTARQYGAMDIGILFSAYYLFIAGAQFFYGPLSDRFGREIFMMLGLTCSALAWGFFPYTGKLSATVLLGISAGSLGGFFVSSMAFLNEKAPDSLKGTISGAYYLFWGMGYFLGPIMWGVCGAFLGMEKSFFAFSAFLLMTAAAICLIKHRYPPAKQA
ncbi:MAG: MFS transporter [Synergistaceae bacterium]|nr:MFS transporter [Synergistaceae bacterium]NLL41516.1 MFS transporter [Synergistaceae bacterium]